MPPEPQPETDLPISPSFLEQTPASTAETRGIGNQLLDGFNNIMTGVIAKLEELKNPTEKELTALAEQLTQVVKIIANAVRKLGELKQKRPNLNTIVNTLGSISLGMILHGIKPDIYPLNLTDIRQQLTQAVQTIQAEAKLLGATPPSETAEEIMRVTASTAQAAKQTIEPSPEQLREKRILVVDDEEIVRESTTLNLRKTFVTVTSASSGEEALALWKQQGGFDLVISDITMPGMTGPELAKELRKLSPNLPIIFITGWSDETAKKIAQTIGNAQVVTKPFMARAEKLKQAIIGMLKTRAAAAEPANKP